MLETVASRRLYGFLILTVLPGKHPPLPLLTPALQTQADSFPRALLSLDLPQPFATPAFVNLALRPWPQRLPHPPASAGLGYYLRTREDARLATITPAHDTSPAAPAPSTKELEAKLRQLRSLDAALKKEDDELATKLARAAGAKAV